MKEIILKEIEKLRVASNNGEIEVDEFLDKFFSLRKILKLESDVIFDDIHELFIQTQITLDNEGNLGKYDIIQLLEDCTKEILEKHLDK
jgi:hypothetical protein